MDHATEMFLNETSDMHPVDKINADGDTSFEKWTTLASFHTYSFISNKTDARRVVLPWEHVLSFDIIRYIFPAIVFSGTIGNILSAIVLMRRSMRSKSIYFYLFLLSIADTIVLYASALKTWIRILTGFEMLHLSAASCKTFMFLLLFGQHMSAWLIVLVSLDRFVAVWFPFKSAIFCNIWRARSTGIVLILIMTLSNSHVFWTIHLMPYFPDLNSTAPPTSFRCAPRQDDWFMNVAFNYVKFASYSFVPFSLVLMFNIGIIIRTIRMALLRRSSSQFRIHFRSSRRNSLSSTRSQNNSMLTTHLKVTYMLLTMSFTWLFLTAPFNIQTLLALKDIRFKSPARQLLSKTICFLLMYLNHSINLLLYCVTGRRFRTEMKDLAIAIAAPKHTLQTNRSQRSHRGQMALRLVANSSVC